MSVGLAASIGLCCMRHMKLWRSPRYCTCLASEASSSSICDTRSSLDATWLWLTGRWYSHLNMSDGLVGRASKWLWGFAVPCHFRRRWGERRAGTGQWMDWPQAPCKHTQAWTNLCFKISCTDKYHYRAHLPTSITVRKRPQQRQKEVGGAAEVMSVHTVLLFLIHDHHFYLILW